MPSRAPNNYGTKSRASANGFKPKRGKAVEFSKLRSSESTSQDEKFQAIKLADSIDETMGFARMESGKQRVGWLSNMHSTVIQDPKVPGGRAGVDFYFLEEDGGTFKATVEYDPYFLIATRRGHEAEVEEWCRRMFEDQIKNVIQLEKEDLQLPNHLLGHRRSFLQLSFPNVNSLLAARKTLLPIAEKNKKNVHAMDTYTEFARFDYRHAVYGYSS